MVKYHTKILRTCLTTTVPFRWATVYAVKIGILKVRSQGLFLNLAGFESCQLYLESLDSEYPFKSRQSTLWAKPRKGVVQCLGGSGLGLIALSQR